MTGAQVCGWCGRRRGAAMPLTQGGAGAGTEVLAAPAEACDVCAGLLGFTPYHPVYDGPHAPGDAWEAVGLLTGVEAGAPRRGRAGCAWCARPGRAGWCATCQALLDAAAHAAGYLLFPGTPLGVLRAAAETVAAACQPAADASRQDAVAPAGPGGRQ